MGEYIPIIRALLGWEPTAMANVVQSLDQPSNYKDSQSRVDRTKQNDLMEKSSTLYVRPHLPESTCQCIMHV